ncbi:MAG: CopG family transcriptional regulator [Deltaproteobacteria bacterium]|nr:CopG family transcriptional regulator [Deltaproteobacteria bacterium]
MPMAKIAVTVDERVAAEMDRHVASGRYPSRSRIVQEALNEKLRRSKRQRLAAECAKLDQGEEKAIAGEAPYGASWPEY